ncbi:hypothetical protein ACFQZE_06485 [Paenibacillus sp. GCM10027627]|uniref:hypothetical protein n=1 Tax=unclassified Paenibacillus TaxID=185978 RepID=UPI00362D52FA
MTEHKPHPIGSIIMVDNYYSHEEFEITGYKWTTNIIKRKVSTTIMYDVKTKNGFPWKVDHRIARLKDDSKQVCVDSGMTTDELLDTYSNYKTLYNIFGDNEYLNKLLEIELLIKTKKLKWSDKCEM